MRVLEFIVNDQILTKNPSCDFSNIVPGTEGYLKAKFSFSPEWNNYSLVAQFFRGNEEHARYIVDNECEIPPEVLKGRTFRVGIIGKRGKCRVPTNQVVITQGVTK